MKFSEQLLGHEIFRSIVSWATKLCLKNLQNPPPLPTSYIVNVRSLNGYFWIFFSMNQFLMMIGSHGCSQYG